MRYVRSRRGFTRVVTVFSVLGILLGVAALIIVLAVMSGFRQELMGRILGMSGHGTLEIMGLQTPVARVLSEELEKIPGIVSATPYVSGQVMVSANGHASGAYVRGVDAVPTMLKEHLILAPQPDAASPTALSVLPANQLLVGEGLAASLGLLPGTGVTLLSPEGARTIVGFIPRTGQFGVAGTFGIGMVQFDNGLLVGRLDDVQAFLGRHETIDALDIRLKDPQLITKLTPSILSVANRFTQSPLDVRLTPWSTANAEFFRALQVERITMFIILSLIVLVAAFNIITGQMMLVNDKLPDIAILRTMGATQRQIMRIFLYNGLLLGGMGTAGGVGLGLLAVWRMTGLVDFIKTITGVDLFPRDIYFLTELPSKLAPMDMVGIVGMAVTLTILASLYPAWRASRLNPVELLRRG